MGIPPYFPGPLLSSFSCPTSLMAFVTILAWNCKGLGDSLMIANQKKLFGFKNLTQYSLISKTNKSAIEMEHTQLELGFSQCCVEIVKQLDRVGHNITLDQGGSWRLYGKQLNLLNYQKRGLKVVYSILPS